MTISKENGIISLNVRKNEFDMILTILRGIEFAAPLTQVMEGYLDTYERD